VQEMCIPRASNMHLLTRLVNKVNNGLNPDGVLLNDVLESAA